MVESTQNQDSILGSRLQQDLKNDLIAGLLVVIPLATTIWLSSIVSKFVLTLVTSVPKQLNPFITQFKPCAITNVNINYTADGTYATYADGSPVATMLQVQFKELKLVFEQEVPLPEGDYSPIASY